jgi:glycosyltransferase involved in cell wall biosynthesis
MTNAPTANSPRIAIASSGLGHIARGVEAWADDLARELHHRGINVTLCKGSGHAAAPYERVIPCCRRDTPGAARAARALPRWLAWRLGLSSVYGVEQTTFAWGLIRFLRREQIDLLHVQDPQFALIIERARRFGWVRTDTVLAHGTEESPDFLRKFTYVQHLSPEHEQHARDAGASRPSWFTIPNFIDTARFSPGRDDALRRELDIPANALVVLSAAAIKKTHKRIDHLLEEVASLRASHPHLPVYLVVAGGSEQQTQEVIQYGQRILGDRVRFLVSFPRDRMPSLYQAADIFVLASLREMMPIALLEAAASGLPCVVNDTPTLRWMVGSGGTCIDMSQPSELSQTLARVLSDEGARRCSGAQMRDHCVAQFGQRAVVDQIIHAYESVLGRVILTPITAQPTVSVIIPTYNGAQWVSDAVRSVLAQTRPAHEVIVIDDGSTDDTLQRLAQFGSRITVVSQPNQGVSAARNHGLAIATGDYIALLDADDLWHPCKLELQLAAFTNNPGMGVLATRTWNADHAPMPVTAELSLTRVPLNRLCIRNYLTNSSVMMRREVAGAVGLFDTTLQGPEDHDYWIRAAERTEIGILEQPLTGYREVQGSLSRRAASMEAGIHRILAKLDARSFWRGKPLLHRRSHAYAAFASSFLYADAGDVSAALRRVIQSLAWYPLPLSRTAGAAPFLRLRRLAALLRRLLADRSKRPTTPHRPIQLTVVAASHNGRDPSAHHHAKGRAA